MTKTSTRARLLASTQAVIAEDGWAAATTRRVADHAGVNPGLVHYHAGSIERLRRDAVIDGVQLVFTNSVNSLCRSTRSDGGDVSTISNWVHTLIDLDPSNSDRILLSRLLQESLAASSRDDELRSSIASLVARYRAMVADALIIQGIGDPLGTASAITAIADGVVLQRMLDPDLDMKPIIACIEDLVAARRA